MTYNIFQTMYKDAVKQRECVRACSNRFYANNREKVLAYHKGLNAYKAECRRMRRMLAQNVEVADTADDDDRVLVSV